MENHIIGHVELVMFSLWVSTNDDLISFHPEIALFRNLCVNLRNYLCGVPLARLRAIP
jgi:hypothetical protein